MSGVRKLPSKKLLATAKKNLSKYQQEVKIRRWVYILGYSSVFLGGLLLFMYIAGDYFNGALARLGIRGITNERSGAYVDCTIPENKNHEYCFRPTPRANRHWKTLKRRGSQKKTAFGLN
ncbi:MAG: hypothetical protein GX589_10490 [Deltaproteobacteria bacterium]|nr:hypothetical protein [Deltaproteobacteria bacterium]